MKNRGLSLNCWDLPSSQVTAILSKCVPVRMEQQNPMPSQGIRFCRWLDAYNQDGNFVDTFADTDRDRFRITMPAIVPNLTKINLKATGLHGAVIDGAFDAGKTEDGDHEEELTQENGAWVSKPILLVTDCDDDKYYNGQGTDDGTNDQTLLGDFGSKVVVKFPELNNAQVEFAAQKAVGQVTLNILYLSPDPKDGVPKDKRLWIDLHVRKMVEIYRQIGIRVEVANIKKALIPKAWLDPGPSFFNPANHLTPSECRDLSHKLRYAPEYRAPARQLRVAFLDARFSPDDPDTIARGFTTNFADGTAVSTVSLRDDDASVLGVTAHEVGHALGLPHDDSGSYRLMYGKPLVWGNKVNDSKRFREADFDEMKATKAYYVPLQ